MHADRVWRGSACAIRRCAGGIGRMTEDSAALAGLTEFRVRLEGGLCPAARRSRPADWQFRDDEAIPDGWPGATFAALTTIHDDPWADPAGPGAAVDALACQLRERHELLITVLFSPGMILDRLRHSLSMSDAGAVDTWIAMCWTSEAVF